MIFDGLLKYFSNKAASYLLGLAAAFGIVLLVILPNNWIEKRGKFVSLKKKELAYFNRMTEEYLKEKEGIGMLEKKLSAETAASTSAIIEDIAEKTEVRDKIKYFKAIEGKTEKNYVKEGVEVKIEGISLNQLTNILYKIKNHRNLLLIKKFSVNTRFDNPSLLDVTMHVVLLIKKA